MDENLMIDNIAIACVLLVTAAIALIIRSRGQAIRALLRGVLQVVMALGSPGHWRGSWCNPLLRLLGILLALIGAGWAATLSQVGFEQVQNLINFERPPPAQGTVGRYRVHETNNCHAIQEMVVYDITGWAKAKHLTLQPGPIDPRYGWDCQFGGSYHFDESGVLYCTLHGRAPKNPALFRLPTEEQ
jgi:hypothetical protein